MKHGIVLPHERIVRVVVNSMFVSFFMVGCAKLSVESTKPIQVDINMRVDVYQHVVKEVDSIENQVFGPSDGKKLNFFWFVDTVYAADGLSEVIERRRMRIPVIEEYFNKGYIGENRSALLQILASGIASSQQAEIQKLVDAENKDRIIIYQATAQKNNLSEEQINRIFLEDHYKRAAAGMWFEMYDASTQQYRWVQK